MRGRAFQSNFAMGILDEEAHGRVDLEVYTGSLGDAVNGIPSTLGSLRRRAGFIDEGAPKYQDMACRLIPFRRSAGDQLMIELGEGHARFRTPDGAPVMDGPDPYEVVTAYPHTAVAGLGFDQSNDVLYLVHKSRTLAPQLLQRHGATDWTYGGLDTRNGPWRTENGDTSKTIEATALTGTVTLTANFDAFTEAMIGEKVRLRLADGQPSCSSWTPATDYKAYELVQSDGKLYVAPGSDKKSGTAAPIHDAGSVSDGAMFWTFLSDGAGVVQISAFTDANTVTAVVLNTLPGWVISSDRAKVTSPASVAFVASSRWAFGAFSERLGWPGHIALTDDDRVALSGSRSEPGVYHLTRVGGYGPDYLDFHPGLGSGRVLDDDAIRKPIRGGGDPIEWLAPAGALMFGTTSRQGVIMASTLEDPLTPADNRARSIASGGGCSDVAPALAHDGVLFAPRGGRGLCFIKATTEVGVQDADLALFVEDLVSERVAGIVWAANPDKVGWIWTEQGSLLAVTYQPKQNQFGWARQPLPGGFKVESAAVITDGDGRDVLWLAVIREKDEETQRRIWRQAARWRDGDGLDQIVYLDGCKFYTGAAVSTLDGLEHLAGETVRVFGNEGALIFDAIVTEDGEISAPEGQTLTKACIGLRYLFLAESLPLDVGGPGETAGALQRVLKVTVYLADCVEAEVSFGDGPKETEGGKPWATNPVPVSQVFKCSVGGATGRDARWRVQTDDCWPVTLRAVRASVQTDD